MADVTPQEMAGKLMADAFSRSGPTAQGLSDPAVETPMVVTLDDLRPYELDPRITRNPLYDEIKASIRERGLDAPPSITRRPGADHYIIRNGGNTRLAILRELWAETKDQRFFRIPSLFRPWPERGEIIALTGHLAENELHGGLTFIERALGVEKARELYEQEIGKTLSQSELARRLTADGYPIPQPHISRMQDTVRYLLPTIPNVLYNGLGRHQVERLAVLRKAAEFTWEKQASGKPLGVDFETLFHDVLAPFDTQPAVFSTRRVQDELIGQMAELLEADYNALELDIDNTEHRQRAVNTPPPSVEATPAIAIPETGAVPPPKSTSTRHDDAAVHSPSTAATDTATPPTPVQPHEPHEPDAALSNPDREDITDAQLQGHIVSPVASTERLQAIQHLVAEQTGEPMLGFAENVLQAIPVQAGSGLFPISDVWYIDPGLDSPDRLRIHIAQFAREIAEEADLTDCIEPLNAGIGFTCRASTQGTGALSVFERTVLALLRALSAHYDAESSVFDHDDFMLDDGLGSLMHGTDISDTATRSRLSDDGLVKFFRLVRLARRLRDLDTNPDETGH